jgi:hypothetical protein
MLDHSIIMVYDDKGNNTIAEIGNDYLIKGIFKPFFDNSEKFFPATVNQPVIMYELKYPGFEKSKEVSIFQHKSMTARKKMLLYNDHANVRRCFRFD